MSQAPKLIVMNMSLGSGVTVGPFIEVMQALQRHRSIKSYEELETFLDDPAGVAVVLPMPDGTEGSFDIDGVRRRAEETGLAVQHLTLNMLEKLFQKGKTAKEVIEQLGL